MAGDAEEVSTLYLQRGEIDETKGIEKRFGRNIIGFTMIARMHASELLT